MAKAPGKKPAAKAPPAKAASPAPKAPSSAQPKPDRRGTPKGRGIVAGGKGGGGKIGNPPHQPTPELRKMAETHAAVGTPHWAIAAEMGISKDTLERHYTKELELGLIRMNARIGSNVAKKALEGDSDMQKFWLGRRGGAAWANKQQTELSTQPGRPLETRDVSGFTDEELAVMAKLYEGD